MLCVAVLEKFYSRGWNSRTLESNFSNNGIVNLVHSEKLIFIELIKIHILSWMQCAFCLWRTFRASCCFTMRFSESTNFQVQRARGIHICTFLPFFSPTVNRVELPRFPDRTRATASFGYSRNYSDAPRTKPGRGKSRYVFRSCAFSHPFARSRQLALPRLIPVPPSRENTKQRVHARKILCRIRRSLAWGHNRWRCRESGKFIRPKSLAWLRRARCARPRNFLLYK